MMNIMQLAAELLKHFCKSFTKDCEVQVDDLRHDLPDEVVDVDMAKIMIFLVKMLGLKSKEEVAKLHYRACSFSYV